MIINRKHSLKVASELYDQAYMLAMGEANPPEGMDRQEAVSIMLSMVAEILVEQEAMTN